jgi:cysteine synthase A
MLSIARHPSTTRFASGPPPLEGEDLEYETRSFDRPSFPCLAKSRGVRYAWVMLLQPNSLALIGNTPMVRLAGPSDATGCDIFAKCEFANPGASVKDRAALFIVNDAEEKGLLKPGGTIVEGTAGNTGIGLALVANAKGYKTIIVMPETQSREKMDTLRALGAELVTVPAAPYSNPGHFVHTSRRLAEETEGAIWANQFDNIANRKAHIVGTAEEIWTQMEGRIDGFTCAAGTGGTIAGVGLGLKAKDEAITIALSDPHGAALYEYYACGELKAEGNSVAEGIGQGRITANLEGAPIDTQFRISDEEGLEWVRRLLSEEGLCLGLSSGINVAGAVALARQLGPGKRIVTILCDTGFRYLSTLYNRQWLESKGLTVFPWLAQTA